jgi:integrating conjugative element protein (TIGR03749 family)
VGLLLTGAALTASASEPPERVAWRKTPIALELRVGTERLVQFPRPVEVGVPAPLQDALRIQSIAGTVYLLAHQPFASTRVLVRGLDGGSVYLLDLSAKVESAATAPVEIFDPDEALESGTDAVQPTGLREYGYVSLTRFAAQQLYAPSRLLEDLPGVVRVPVKRDPVALVRGDTIEALPLVAWRAGDLFVTAVKLTNQTDQPQILDPRTLRGAWLTATFQHNRLLGAGDEADRTVVYLISARPFASSL